MKKTILIIVIALLLQSCFSYKLIDKKSDLAIDKNIKLNNLINMKKLDYYQVPTVQLLLKIIEI